MSLGRTLAARGRLDQAKVEADEARAVFEDFADPVRQVRAARFLAAVAMEEGNPGEARAGLDWAGRIARFYHLDGQTRQIARDFARLAPQEG